ncbi:SH3 domain-binding protein 1 isoform X1 [Pseudophryne corroboree]|uniref:SH3 domain-binding protein 1 isoform X1 n=2 Tax=Pseudophryne corroboree TaxID=495146 RepID=UPI0030818977
MIQRQLNRMRQLANLGPGRSQDVTDLLTEDLLLADQQVEIMKKVAHLVGKRLTSCMQGQTGSDMDKRLKKLALMSLSMAMADCMKDMESESSLRRTLEMGCCVEGSLAQSMAEFEMNMEKDVLQPLNKLSEEELPTIIKHRKQLQKLLTDWNSTKNRMTQAQKNISAGQGGASAGMPAKLESLREEEEDLRRRLEQSKDDYLSDLCYFSAKEAEYENYFVRLLELQAEYHKKSLAHLTDALGELRDTLKESGQLPGKHTIAEVYGVPLATHLSRFGCQIALPISACVRMLLAHGMQEEGLFRLAAGASVLKKMKGSLGAGDSDLAEFVSEPHAVAGALKSYLRELPQPLMTSELFDAWMKAASIKEPEKLQEYYREVCQQLPPENYNNLRYVIKFLAMLAEHQEVNKMTPSNIAIVLGPNLLWARSDGDPSVLDIASAFPILVVSVVEGLITCASEVFPGDADFGVPESMIAPSSLVPLKPDSLPQLDSSSAAMTEQGVEIQEQVSINPAALKTVAPTEEGCDTPAQVDFSPSTVRKVVKRPAPLRPMVAPPVQPRGSPNTDTSDALQNPRPIPRRNFGGSLRVPNMPPPNPPQLVQGSNVKSEGGDTESSKNKPPRPLPRNRIQSTDN